MDRIRELLMMPPAEDQPEKGYRTPGVDPQHLAALTPVTSPGATYNPETQQPQGRPQPPVQINTPAPPPAAPAPPPAAPRAPTPNPLPAPPAVAAPYAAQTGGEQPPAVAPTSPPGMPANAKLPNGQLRPGAQWFDEQGNGWIVDTEGRAFILTPQEDVGRSTTFAPTGIAWGTPEAQADSVQYGADVPIEQVFEQLQRTMPVFRGNPEWGGTGEVAIDQETGEPYEVPPGVLDGTAVDPSFTWDDDPMLAEARVQLEAMLNSDLNLTLEQKIKALIAFGDEELAKQMLGENHPAVEAIRANELSTVKNIEKESASDLEQLEEELNSANLHYGGYRLGKALPQHQERKLAAKGDAMSRLQAALQALRDEETQAQGRFNQGLYEAETDAYDRAVQMWLQYGLGGVNPTPTGPPVYTPPAPQTAAKRPVVYKPPVNKRPAKPPVNKKPTSKPPAQPPVARRY